MSEFKEMKFWIGDDEELSKQVQKILNDQGYEWGHGESVQNTGSLALYTTLNGRIIYSGDTNRVGIKHFDTEPEQEINIGWMRTAKQETIELGGKTYIKSELEEALSHIKPINQET